MDIRKHLIIAKSELFQEFVYNIFLEPVRLEVHVIPFHDQPVEQVMVLELAKSKPVVLIQPRLLKRLNFYCLETFQIMNSWVHSSDKMAKFEGL